MKATFWYWAFAASALAWLPQAHAAAANAATVTRPAGAYRQIRLVLEKVGRDESPLTIVFSTRDGKVTRPLAPVLGTFARDPKYLLPLRIPRKRSEVYLADVSRLRLEGSAVEGELEAPIVHPGSTRTTSTVYHIEAAIDARTVAGRYRCESRRPQQNGKVEAFQGAVTGEALSPETLAERNALGEGTSWPAWHGPSHNMVAAPSNNALVDRLDQARLVWRSEEPTPAAPGSIMRSARGGEAHQRRIGGGGASPVVADGAVYLFYHVPSGTVHDEPLLERLKKIHDAIAKEQGAEAADAEKRRWLVDADDVVLAVDAATGATLWKAVLEGKGLNWQEHKDAYSNHSAAVGGGRVVAMGTTMRLYCFDATTGQLQWETGVGRKHEMLEKARADGLAARRMGTFLMKWGRNRTNGGAPIIVGNTVVTPDYTSHLDGYDLATGRRLWEAEGVCHYNASPVAWANGGTHYVVGSGPEKIALVRLSDGKVMWTVPVPHREHFTVGVAGEHLVCLTAEAKDGAKPMVVCYRIQPEAAKEIWRIEHPRQRGTNSQVPILLDGHVLVSGSEEGQLWKIELATGKVVGRGDAFGGNSLLTFAGDGRYFTVRDGKHGTVEIAMHDLATLATLGEMWRPPNPSTTSYHTPMSFPCVDGRLFIRGDDALYCYDLRKPKAP